MATVLNQYISTNGDILIPLEESETNTSNLLSLKTGEIYIALTSEILPIEVGNPMGLLLTLTYAVAPS